MKAGRVVMLTQSAWQHNSRVVREAEAVRSAGYEVTVVCRGAETRTDEAGGVRYVTVERASESHLRTLPRAFAAHLQVLAADALGVWRGPDRLQRLLSGFELLTLAALSAPAALLGATVLALRRSSVVAEFWRQREWRRRLARSAWRFIGHLTQSWVYLNEFSVATRTHLADAEPSVVHAHDLVTLSAGARVSRAAGAALIYDAHELETETNYWALNALTQREVRRYERALTPATAAVVTVCDSIADWLARKYRLPRPIVVLNAPSATSRPTRTDLRETLELAESVPLAVYVGSVTIDRGLENCVRALADAPGLHLAMVGPRNARVEETLLRLAAELDVHDHLHLVDPVPPESVTSFIESASCSVIAIQNVCLSYAYCLPNKLLESVFAGLPVAVSNLPEMRGFVESVGCGLVMDETDPAAIARTLIVLAENPQRYRLHGSALQRVTQEFGWQAQCTKLLELYARLGDEPRDV